MRRLAVLVFAVALAFAAAPAPTRAQPAKALPAPRSALEALVAATKAVTWAVDHDAKTVTATVHLTLATSCTTAQMQQMARVGPAMAARCIVSQDVVDAVKADVAKTWNNGNKYRCYLLVVVVDVKVDNTPDDRRPPSTADDRVTVRIDQTSANIRSFVMATSGAGATWNGNTPGDRLTPTNGGQPPATWAYPPTWEKSLYAHETAHVMGLSDQYEDFVGADGKTYSRPKAGAPDDALANVTKTTVDQTTVDRLVERADPFKNDPPKCDYKIDTIQGWYHFTSLKCGGPEGEWTIKVDGTYPLGGASLSLTGDGVARLARTPSRSFAGTWDAQFRIDLVGVPASTGGQAGMVDGTAELTRGTLHLRASAGSASYWATTPYSSLGGPADNPAKDFDLPVTNGSFCP